jgi:hypothetical protein
MLKLAGAVERDPSVLLFLLQRLAGLENLYREEVRARGRKRD